MDVLETALGEMLLRAKLLDSSAAWLEAISPGLKAKTIRDWIQEDQLFRKGVDENDDIIGLYTPLTEKLSGGRKKAGTPFTLYDTGDFYRSMFVTVLRDAVVIDADTEKMEDQNWWGDEILGLTDENLEKFVFEIQNNYIRYARRVLGLN